MSLNLHLGDYPASVRKGYQPFTPDSPFIRFQGNANGNYNYLARPWRLPGSHATVMYDERRYTKDSHLQAVLKRHLHPGDPILELGCSNGNNLLPLAETYHTYGVDVSPMPLAELKATIPECLRNNINVARWDFAESGDVPWPEMKGKFKAIYAVHVLSHLPDKALKRAMPKLMEYLAPGGIVVVTAIDPLLPSPSQVLTGVKKLKTKMINGLVELLNPNPISIVVNDDTRWRRFIRDIGHYGCLLVLCSGLGTLHEYTLTNAGLKTHSEKSLDTAFHGLKKIDSRKFKPGELNGWILPESRLRWVVYQKPLDREEVSEPGT